MLPCKGKNPVNMRILTKNDEVKILHYRCLIFSIPKMRKSNIIKVGIVFAKIRKTLSSLERSPFPGRRSVRTDCGRRYL